MYCPKCGTQMSEQARFCSGCGHKKTKGAGKLLMITTILVAIACIAIFSLLGVKLKELIPKQETANEVVKKKEENIAQTKGENPQKQAVSLKKMEQVEAPKDVSQIINTSQEKVFTIFTDMGQGSGFLINKKGDILTNAHVVEGDINPVVRAKDGTEYEGRLIGYSNTTDIALIRVPALANHEPLPLETANPAKIGEEVIALGSPKGYENTATLGNISGVNRTFIINPFHYEGIYQTSAAIAPGSSGGPLLNKKDGKVIAINSARDSSEVNIGFSIPVYKIIGTVNEWVKSPMKEDNIFPLFYYEEGVYYYNDYADDAGYFEGGDYNEDYYEYYEFPYEEAPADESYEEYESSESEYSEPEYSEPDYNEEESYVEPYEEEDPSYYEEESYEEAPADEYNLSTDEDIQQGQSIDTETDLSLEEETGEKVEE
ncbi:trypsin-like peptidase domain-containing protein [Metabacillus fastidiosus]|uniref:trypsin-like peptidase domain-containing protein n=1 Tax=Metabacillus fastidiosus TaxID=1458 RepID=UPI003D285B0C